MGGARPHAREDGREDGRRPSSINFDPLLQGVSVKNLANVHILPEVVLL